MNAKIGANNLDYEKRGSDLLGLKMNQVDLDL